MCPALERERKQQERCRAAQLPASPTNIAKSVLHRAPEVFSFAGIFQWQLRAFPKMSEVAVESRAPGRSNARGFRRGIRHLPTLLRRTLHHAVGEGVALSHPLTQLVHEWPRATMPSVIGRLRGARFPATRIPSSGSWKNWACSWGRLTGRCSYPG